MKTTARLIAMLLVACFCFTLVACNGDPAKTGNENTGTAPGTGAGTETGEPADTAEKLEIPEGVRYDDYEFSFLGVDNGPYSHVDLSVEDLTEEPINDAVYERNEKIKELLGVTITSKNDSYANIITTARNNISTNTEAYDVYFPAMTHALPLATEGYLENLYDVPYLDITKSWWDQCVNRDLTLKGKLFFTTGDITITDEDLCYVIAFNKQYLNEVKADENPYDLVKEKKWTLDKFSTIIKDLNQDTNGDGNMTSTDDWGFITFPNATTVFYQATGERIVTPDENGVYYFAMQTERATEVLEDVFSIMIGDGFWRTDRMDGARDTTTAFKDGSVIFRTLVFETVRQFRQMEMDFGVLPFPLYDEDQEWYQTPTSSQSYLPGICIPSNSEDMERTGIVLEAMAYYSKQLLTPAFYDVSVKGILARDDESRDMLDIIFGNKIFDPGYVFDIGSQGLFLHNMTVANQIQFSSTLDSIKDKMNSSIQDLLEAFDAL